MSGVLVGLVGIGKIEIIKDFGRVFGMMVYVFNCLE